MIVYIDYDACEMFSCILATMGYCCTCNFLITKHNKTSDQLLNENCLSLFHSSTQLLLSRLHRLLLACNSLLVHVREMMRWESLLTHAILLVRAD